MGTAHSVKTVRQRIAYRPGVSEWFETTQELFNRVAAFYFEVLQSHPDILDLSSKDALTSLERITHTTKDHPNPPLPLAEVARNIPAYFRRAAIHTAFGVARAFRTNRENWEVRKERAAVQGRPCYERPPRPPRGWGRAVTFYSGMYKQRANGRITLKLWDGRSWRWARFRLSGQDLPEGGEAGSPQVVKRGSKLWLHTPVKQATSCPEKVERQLQAPGTRLCAVDLNVGEALAVCVILTTDGTALATRFIRGGDQLHGRRKSLLGKIARNRGRTGAIMKGEQDNVALWARVSHLDQDAAHRVSRRIVEFAQAHGATVIVFEHLERFRPKRGRYSRQANSKRAYWLRGRIFQYTRYKAWGKGILTSRVSPKNTSQQCACCGGAVARYGQGEQPIGYRPGAPLVSCPDCGMRGHADRNAGLNIGRRLLTRYGNLAQEKPPTGQPSWARRSPKGEGVLVSQEAQNRDRPHAKPERHGARDGHGTARRGSRGAARGSDGIPRPLRPQGSGSTAAGPLGVAHAGVPEEAAGF